MRWGAIFGGAVLALGLWMMLQVLGTGLGLATVDAANAGSLRGAGIGTGIWSLLAPLIAMFVGGILAGRLAGTRERGVGAWHGAVMWGLTTLIGLYLILSAVSTIVGGAVRAGGAVVQGAGQAVAGVAGKVDVGEAIQTLGIRPNDLLAPINERLQREGKPPVTARELNATMRAVAQRGVREGHLDREVLVAELARNTSLSRADAEQIADQFGGQYEQASKKLAETGEQVKEAGLNAVDTTGKALLLGGVMMAISLGAALAGGIVGARSTWRHERRDLTDDDRTVGGTRTTVVSSAPPPPVTPAPGTTTTTTSSTATEPGQIVIPPDETP
ncbi:MAG: hypothetical protein KF773_25045 [Deltaproteobacteria bacterium]|nr:hypothetical protein [Deltaproteobacteria bacterium]